MAYYISEANCATVISYQLQKMNYGGQDKETVRRYVIEMKYMRESDIGDKSKPEMCRVILHYIIKEYNMAATDGSGRNARYSRGEFVENFLREHDLRTVNIQNMDGPVLQPPRDPWIDGGAEAENAIRGFLDKKDEKDEKEEKKDVVGVNPDRIIPRLDERNRPELDQKGGDPVVHADEELNRQLEGENNVMTDAEKIRINRAVKQLLTRIFIDIDRNGYYSVENLHDYADEMDKILTDDRNFSNLYPDLSNYAMDMRGYINYGIGNGVENIIRPPQIPWEIQEDEDGFYASYNVGDNIDEEPDPLVPFPDDELPEKNAQPYFLYSPNLSPEVWASLSDEAKADIKAHEDKVKSHNEFLRLVGTEPSVPGTLIEDWENEWRKKGVQNQTSIQRYVEEKLKGNREQLAKKQIEDEMRKIGITDPNKINKMIQLFLERKYSIDELNTDVNDLKKEVSVMVGEPSPYLAWDETRPLTIEERNHREILKHELNAGLQQKAIRVNQEQLIFRKKIIDSQNNEYGLTKPYFEDYERYIHHLDDSIKPPQEKENMYDPLFHGTNYITPY